jgi:hypothetical protein
MSAFLAQNRATPDGGRVVYAWDLSEPEAFCDKSWAVIVAGTSRCAAHEGALAPCPVAYRMPGECRHPALEVAVDGDAMIVRCMTCGHVSVPVPPNVAKRVTEGPAAPVTPDESLDVVMIGDPDADHSSLLTPDAS